MASIPWRRRIGRALRALVSPRPRRRGPSGRGAAPAPGRPSRSSTDRSRPGPAARRPPGDFTGTVRAVYAPKLDGVADPGEIVWTWVPFEEDPRQGKDRPVLIVGRDGRWLLALMLTSKDHSRSAAGGEAARRWVDIGAGDWDPRRRPSEVRLDRVLRIDPAAVRREGAIMNRRTFELVTRSLSQPQP